MIPFIYYMLCIDHAKQITGSRGQDNGYLWRDYDWKKS